MENDYEYEDDAAADIESGEETPICQNCGKGGGDPLHFDGGIDPETGYHDEGDACTLCVNADGSPKLEA